MTKIFKFQDNSLGQWVNGEWIAPVIFTCESNTISEADEAYKQTIGKDPAKQKEISVVSMEFKPFAIGDWPKVTAYQFLIWWKVNRRLPMSTEKPCTEPSNSEIKRWLMKKSAEINGQRPGPDDIIDSVESLVFFPKGKNRCTML